MNKSTEIGVAIIVVTAITNPMSVELIIKALNLAQRYHPHIVLVACAYALVWYLLTKRAGAKVKKSKKDYKAHSQK